MTAESRRTLILEALRHGRISAPQLTRRVGGSVRTIYRDIRRLRALGYPIGGAVGRAGGFWLEDHSRPVPLDLSAADLHEVVLAVVRSAHQGALTTTRDPERLVEQLLNAFPARPGRHLRTALKRLELQGAARCPTSALTDVATGAHERRLVWVSTDRGGTEFHSREPCELPVARIRGGLLRVSPFRRFYSSA